jgi:outer membrane protein OmpA-like peptidoglycan-associated protein
MGRIVILAVLLISAIASAAPVSYQLQGDVAVGKKPMIEIRAVQPVTALRIDLERDDGKHFTVEHASLGKGASVRLAIGDGAAGKASYKGTLSGLLAGQKDRWSEDLTFETLVRAPIKVTYDLEHLDLDKRVLQFKVSRTAGSAELTVIGDDGKELATNTATYAKEPADTWLPITWKQPAGTRVMMWKLRVVTADGLATNLELIPWSVTIDHEDVKFATDSAVIEPAESSKLDSSVGKIADVVKRSERFMKMTLYVAGHTDTVGPNAKNRKLSLDRARAIAAYFRKAGIKLPIAFAGFGEEVLKVKTADSTDERANRRADYVIGPSAGAPPFKGPYLKAKAEWKRLR